MSFLKPKDTVEEGDTVILYISIKSMHAIDVQPTIVNKKGETIENVFQTTFGALKVRNLVGVTYGTKVELSRGWAYVLQPNPELWTVTLPHRTQILYTTDMSLIIQQLDIAPGSVVIESGTGSGSLSHYFLRAVKPTGHLHTFDFHEARADQARDEFQRHGLSDFVTVYHRDVCKMGFAEELNGKADAVLLDLPSPHLAVPHAVRALKDQGGRFCSFSPCIEQSQKCSQVLRDSGFIDIHSVEIIQQEHIIKSKNIPVMELEYLKHKKPTETADDSEMPTSKNENSGDKSKSTDPKQPPRELKKYLTSSAPATMAAHTGFLTFATWPPIFAR